MYLYLDKKLYKRIYLYACLYLYTISLSYIGYLYFCFVFLHLFLLSLCINIEKGIYIIIAVVQCDPKAIPPWDVFY